MEKETPGKKSAPADRFARFVAALTPSAARALAGPPPARPATPADPEYAAWAARLTPSAQAALDAVRPPAPARPDPDVPRYCLFECVDGEWPTLRVYGAESALLHRLASLEGHDVCALVVYGKPLRFSRAPVRFLERPDGVTYVRVPPASGGPAQVVDADLFDDSLEWQLDGYVGSFEPDAEGDDDVLPGDTKLGPPDEDEDEDDEEEDDEEDEDA